MGRQILSLLVIALTLSMAYSLKCRICMGPKGGDCANGEEKGQMNQTCSGLSSSATSLNFSSDLDRDIVCVTYTSTESADYTTGVIKGCGYIYKDVDICDYMEEIGIATECLWCKNDLCNQL